MSLELFADIYRNAGFKVELSELRLNFELEEHTFHITVDEEWKKVVVAFFKAKQFEFEPEGRVLYSYRCVEFQVVRLDPAFLPRPEHEFVDDKRNKVCLSSATSDFTLSILTADDNKSIMDLIKRRVLRRIENRHSRPNDSIRLRLDDILINFHTARYVIPRKIKKELLIERARSRIKACLFKLAFSYNEAWELRESIRSRGISFVPPDPDVDNSIPRATYIDDLVCKRQRIRGVALLPAI